MPGSTGITELIERIEPEESLFVLARFFIDPHQNVPKQAPGSQLAFGGQRGSDSELFHPELERGPVYPQACRRAVWSGDNPSSLF